MKKRINNQKVIKRDYTPQKGEFIDWYYYIETEDTIYRSRDLTRCLNLWRDNKDTSEILNVGEVGMKKKTFKISLTPNQIKVLSIMENHKDNAQTLQKLVNAQLENIYQLSLLQATEKTSRPPKAEDDELDIE